MVKWSVIVLLLVLGGAGILWRVGTERVAPSNLATASAPKKLRNTVPLASIRATPSPQPLAMSEEELSMNGIQEEELNHWNATVKNNQAPIPAILDRQADVSGEWNVRRGYNGSSLSITPSPSGRYIVHFDTGGCLSQWALQRTAIYDRGTFILNRPVVEYCPATYKRLYSVRVADKEYLVPDVSVEEFQRALSPDGKRIIDRFAMEFCAFQRDTTARQ